MDQTTEHLQGGGLNLEGDILHRHHRLGAESGMTSKAFPTNLIYGFAPGKKSSPSQKKMAIIYIKTDINNIAQRKPQLDNAGFLAANKNVSIPPESLTRLAGSNKLFHE